VWFGSYVEQLALAKGLVLNAESRAGVIKEASRALIEAATRLKQNATGDYSPDPVAARFPPWEVWCCLCALAEGAATKRQHNLDVAWMCRRVRRSSWSRRYGPRQQGRRCGLEGRADRSRGYRPSTADTSRPSRRYSGLLSRTALFRRTPPMGSGSAFRGFWRSQALVSARSHSFGGSASSGGKLGLACCRFLKFESFTHAGESIACSRFAGRGHGRLRRNKFCKPQKTTPHSCVVDTWIAANYFRRVFSRHSRTGAQNDSFPILKGNAEKSGCEADWSFRMSTGDHLKSPLEALVNCQRRVNLGFALAGNQKVPEDCKKLDPQIGLLLNCGFPPLW
jgi:hypothetical protein